MKENVIRFSDVESCIIELRDQRVLLDRDVAMLYDVETKETILTILKQLDVETKEINQAVKNNPDKFPAGYLIECNKVEKAELVKNFDRFNPLKHSTALPTAFTEKGLYMLATILKSNKATQTTIAIVEAFARIKELSRTVLQLPTADEAQQKTLMQRTSELMADLLDDEPKVTDSETTIELNLAVLKFKHTVKRR